MERRLEVNNDLITGTWGSETNRKNSVTLGFLKCISFLPYETSGGSHSNEMSRRYPEYPKSWFFYLPGIKE